MLLTAEQLASAVGIPADSASAWVPHINEVIKKYYLDSPARLGSFLAQTGHESASFTRLEEGLNYSAEALVRVWPRRFALEPVLGGTTQRRAADYARQPLKIANLVYAHRMGNGDEASGHGWKFRGKGLIQITGKDNHVRCGHALNLPLYEKPELLLEPRNAAMSAGWFWVTNALNALADDGDFQGMTRKINGGLHGIEDRTARLVRAMGVLTYA